MKWFILGVVVMLVIFFLFMYTPPSLCSVNDELCTCTAWLCTCGTVQYAPTICDNPAPQAKISTAMGPVTFSVAVVDDDLQRSRGLMHRTAMADDEGMFFLFDQPQLLSFWMKNTHIPLDIIFINEQLEIVTIASATPCKNVPCPTYSSKEHAKYVLEINAGIAQAKGVSVGDTVQLTDTRLQG